MANRLTSAFMSSIVVVSVLVIGAMPASAFIVEPLQPGPPTGLTGSNVTSSEVELVWTAPSSGNPPFSYRIYDWISPGGVRTLVKSPTITATKWVVTGLSGGTTYDFVVAAVDAANNQGADSVLAPITTLPSAGASPSVSAPASSSASPPASAPASSSASPPASAPASSSASPTASAPASSSASPTASAPASSETSPTAKGVPSATSATTSSGTPVTPSGSAPWAAIVPVAVIGGAIGGVVLLVRRRRRRRPRQGPVPGGQPAAGSGVHAVPQAGPPDVVSIHVTGTGTAHSVSFVPDPGTSTTTFEKVPP